MSDEEVQKKMETKSMRLKKLLSGRVIRNTKCFGWHLYDRTDVEETTTWVDSVDAEHMYGDKWKFTPHYNSETKYFIELSFYRKSEWFRNLGGVKILEFFYNLIFLIRRIIGALLPAAFVIAMILAITSSSSNNDATGNLVGAIFGGTFMSWLLLIVLEDIFAVTARGILKPADGEDASFRVQSDGSYSHASGYGNDISVVKKIFLSIGSVVGAAVGFFIGGALGDAIALSLTENSTLTQGKFGNLSVIVALFGTALTLFLIVVTMIKIWKAKTSRILFMILDVIIPAALMVLLMIVQV